MDNLREIQRIVGKHLKDQSTQAEGTLWPHLRNRRMLDMKFRRQRRVDRFWPDFCCDELKLIVELDGGIHDDPFQRERDRERQIYLEANNYMVLRIRNEEIKANLNAALARIRSAIWQRQDALGNDNSPPSPPRGRGAGGEGHLGKGYTGGADR